METEKQPIFRRSAETQACLDLILQAEPGDVLPYQAFELTTGMDRASCQSSIDSARRIALKEHRIVTDAVVKVGIKRLRNEEIPGTRFKALSHIRRTAQRGAQRVSCVEYDTLSPDGKVGHNAMLTVCAIVQKVTKPQTMKKLEGAVAQTKQALPMGAALKRLGVQMDEKEGEKK